jgi:hypothetical protein
MHGYDDISARSIVIVTCLRDIDLFQLQVCCLNHFLRESCHVHIIINEPELQHRQYFKRCLSPILGRLPHHRWTYHDGCDYIDYQISKKSFDFHGWATQQCLKLLFDIGRPRLILDTKDILVKPCHWVDIFQEVETYDLSAFDSYLYPSYREFRTILQQQFPMVSRIGDISTPRIFRSDITTALIQHYGGATQLTQWLIWLYQDKRISISEFMLYDFFRGGAVSTKKEFLHRLLTYNLLDQQDHCDQTTSNIIDPGSFILFKVRSECYNGFAKKNILLWLHNKGVFFPWLASEL